ncbi:MAG: PAS domain-containing protein [Hyphomicrobiaceae bacterium]
MSTPDLAQLVHAVGDAIVVSDAQGLITLWNPGAERMFGFTAAEALGQSLDIIIPERQRERHWDGYEKTMATGVTRYGNDVLRVPAINKAGDSLSISFTVGMLFKRDGTVESIAAVMRDETRKFHQDKALRTRLRELEAQLGSHPPKLFPAAPSKDTAPAATGCPVKHD